MEWGKAKSILIALMLAVNILLGVNIGVQLYERHKSQNETARMACQILLEQGVTAGEDMLLTMPDAMIGYIYSRDTAVEEAAASALLGAVCFSFGGVVSPLVGIGDTLLSTGAVFVACALCSWLSLRIAPRPTTLAAA